jgi:hypothetical protein
VLTVTLNFNLLPLFYILATDEDVKAALLAKDYWKIFKLFINPTKV